MYKIADVRTNGTALDGTAARKSQTFGSRGAGGTWVMGTKFLGVELLLWWQWMK